MAYAVLRFANSSEELPVVVQAVDELIAEHLAAHARHHPRGLPACLTQPGQMEELPQGLDDVVVVETGADLLAAIESRWLRLHERASVSQMIPSGPGPEGVCRGRMFDLPEIETGRAWHSWRMLMPFRCSCRSRTPLPESREGHRDLND